MEAAAPEQITGVVRFFDSAQNCYCRRRRPPRVDQAGKAFGPLTHRHCTAEAFDHLAPLADNGGVR
jgi:hypothetical protein